MAESAAHAAARDGLRTIWLAAGGLPVDLDRVEFTGEGSLPSCFPTSDLAAASIAAAGLAISELISARHHERPRVRVDRRLASFWFDGSLRPQGWQAPPAWDAIAGDYACADGWIRLHTNALHHRAAALAALGVAGDRQAVAAAVAQWQGEALEAAVIEHGGCSAFMRSAEQWASHPQGLAVGAEPYLWRTMSPAVAAPAWPVLRTRPLQGIRVLDLTRILAGPVATRCLAGFGAHVLRIDPPGWDETALAPEVTLGKRCARVDLRDSHGRALFESLLRDAHVLVHGYRPDALARLGFDAERRRELNPGLVDVSLDAYGWTGPWKNRRGFDSLVQMSTGIAEAGMRATGRPAPAPLPVQALDHATGYVLATAVVRGLTDRLVSGAGSTTRASLARTAGLLTQLRAMHGDADQGELAAQTPADVAEPLELTPWGPARRLRPPLEINGAPACWDLPAGPLGSSAAAW